MDRWIDDKEGFFLHHLLFFSNPNAPLTLEVSMLKILTTKHVQQVITDDGCCACRY